MRARIPSALSLTIVTLGCVTYQPAPLLPRDALAQAVPLDLPRLRVLAKDLHHSLLQPIDLDLSHGLDPEQAAVLAVLLNPELRATRDLHGEAEAQLMVAGLLPNPDLNVDFTHPSGGTEPLVNTAAGSLTFDVEALRTRGARRAAAQAELAQVDLGIAWQEWATAEEARLQTVRLSWLQQRVAIVREEITFEQETEQTLERALVAGDATLAQLGVQRAALEAIRRSARELEQTAQEAEAALLALLGRPAGMELGVAPPAPPSEVTPVAEHVVACLDRRLDLEALRRGYQAQEARVRLAVLRQFPALSVGLTANRDETGLRFLGGFVTIGVPLLDRGRAAITLQQATRTRLQHEFEARALAARSQIEATGERIGLLARQLSQSRGAIDPLATLEARERDAAMRGDIDRLAYQQVRSSLVEQRLEAAALSQALAEAGVALETACGGPVATMEGDSK